MLDFVLTEDDKILVQSIHLSTTKDTDKVVWNLTSHGHYSVKTGYNLATSIHNANYIPIDPPHGNPIMKTQSEELKLRLVKLREIAERKEYAELIKDITPKKQVEEPFSSYKDQLGFGLHVSLTMLTGYLVGYASFRALFNRNPALSAAGGIIGLVLAMLVETLLFIIKTSKDDQIQSSKSFTPTTKKNQ